MNRREPVRIFIVSVIIMALSLPAGSESLDEVVLSRLGVSEILTFLDAWTAEEGYSDAALAAKYIWGYVPPDRKPDISLTQYWQALPFSEQRRIKIRWFREHYYELSIEQVSKHVNLEYLVKQAKDEYRETPFELGRKIPKIMATNPGVAGATLTDTTPDKEKKIQTAVKNAKNKKPAGVAKPAPSDTAAIKPAKPASDTAIKPAKVGTPADLLNKLPWHGLPSTLSNK